MLSQQTEMDAANSEIMGQIHKFNKIFEKLQSELIVAKKFGQMVECSFKNEVVLGSSPVAVITLSLFDKVTIGTYNLVFVILNVVSALVLDSTQSVLQFNSR